MSRARLRENSSTSTLPIFIGSWDGARKGRSSLLANYLAARLAAGSANAALCADIVTQTCSRRHGLRQSATQGIFMGNPWRPRKRFKTRRAAPAVLVSTYYHAILGPWMTSQGIFITY